MTDIRGETNHAPQSELCASGKLADLLRQLDDARDCYEEAIAGADRNAMSSTFALLLLIGKNIDVELARANAINSRVLTVRARSLT